MSTQARARIEGRMFGLCGAFAAGTLIAEAARPAPVIAIACGLAGALVAMAWRRLIPLLLGLALLGLALTGMRLASLDGAALAAGARVDARARLTGQVMTEPLVAGGAVRFVLGVSSAAIDAEPVTLRERAMVTVRPPPDTPFTVGSILTVDANLAPVMFPDMDARGRASAQRLVYRGVAARAFASPKDVSIIGRSGHPLVVVADAGRAAMRRAAEHVPRRLQGLFLGVTIGDVERMPSEVAVDFRRTGLSHLVAVSGANVAMVLAVVVGLLRILRVGPRMTTALLIACVLAFMAVTRFEPSVMRAGAMAVVGLVGAAYGARRAALNVLGTATLILLVHDPFLIHAVGFQLSLLATLGILVLGPRLARALGGGPLATATAITGAAQLAVAPLLLLHFHQLSIVSLAANLLVAPAVAPATIIGMVAGAFGAIWAPLASIAVGTIPVLAWMQWTAGVLSQLPFVTLGTPAGIGGLVLVIAAALLAVALARGWRPYRLGPVVLSVALVATGGVWVRALDAAPALTGLVIEMIDVGQGEAILVRAGKQVMLVDGGPEPELLVQELRARGIVRLDVVVLTHPHEDHVAGLVPIARSFAVGSVLDPFIDDDLASYRTFVTALEERRIERARAVAGTSFQLGPARVEVLWPPAEHLTGTGSDINNNSIVARVVFGSDRLLLSGEVEEAGMEAILATEADLSARVLKVSHHGSARMIPEFYQASGASHALIPVGLNTYGHPAAETLIALRAMHVLRSDLSGDVSVSLDGAGGLQVREEHAPRAVSPEMSGP